jgi:hypothetical protein
LAREKRVRRYDNGANLMHTDAFKGFIEVTLAADRYHVDGLSDFISRRLHIVRSELGARVCRIYKDANRLNGWNQLPDQFKPLRAQNAVKYRDASHGHRGLIAEEAVSLDLPDVSSTFADLALFWTKFADMNVYCDRLDHLIERLGVKTIAPTHGLPITDVKATVPKVQAGLKAAALLPESGTNEKVPLTGACAGTPAT